jgi:hypothetical protein
MALMLRSENSIKTKKTWESMKNTLDKVEPYNIEQTIEYLRKDNFYKALEGRGVNRTLIKQDLRLYKSIMKHTEHLKEAFEDQKSHKNTYNFTNRIRFLVEKNLDLNQLKCKCGKKYTWTTYCRYCPDYKRNQLGISHTEDTKKKMRLSALNYINSLKGQVIPRYNKSSIVLIEEYGRMHGYNFMHAENGGEYFIRELGYFLDGYDPIKNVAIEVDEKRHFINGELCAKDIERQKQIENLLECTFIRLKYD